MSILKVENLSKSFGGIHANQDISFEVQAGEILGVIGPNGAGKSTLFDLITGFTKPDKGSVIFQDQNIFGLRPDKISNLGVGRTFQKLKPFADQTLLENVMIGAFSKENNQKVARDKALEIIEFVQLLAPTSTDQTITNCLANKPAMVYYITQRGVTGSGNLDYVEITENLIAIRNKINVPLVTGFGIKTTEHVKQFKNFTDGIVIGSSIVDILSKPNPITTLENYISPIIKEIKA